MHVRTLALGLVLFALGAGPTSAEAQRATATGHVTHVRMGTLAVTSGASERPTLVFRVSGSDRTFVVELDPRSDADGSFALRMHMAAFVEEALRGGYVITVEHAPASNGVALITSVQMDEGAVRTRASVARWRLTLDEF